MPKTCPGCGAENKIQASICERCTRSFQQSDAEPWVVRYRWHLLLGLLAALGASSLLFSGEPGENRDETARAGCQTVVNAQRGADDVLRVTNQGENNQKVIITLGFVGANDEFACRTTDEGITTAEVWETGS